MRCSIRTDEHNRLHVWDLAVDGRPSLQRITGLGQPVKYEHTLAYEAILDKNQTVHLSPRRRTHMFVYCFLVLCSY